MNKIIVLLACLLHYFQGVSQKYSGSDGILFADDVMGKHISYIKDSLFCAEGSNPEYVQASEHSCRSFVVKKINGDKSKIGNIIFSYAFVFTNFKDTSGIIDNVSFMNTYGKAFMIDYQEKFSDDYKMLLKYLVKLFGKKGKTGEVHKDKKYYHHNLIWQHEKLKYLLTKDIQKNFLGISFSVQAKK